MKKKGKQKRKRICGGVGGTCTLNNETGHVQVKNIQIKEPM
jgi:hypothetical protein